VRGDIQVLDVVELGRGTAYFSAWPGRCGARPTGWTSPCPARVPPGAAQDRSDAWFPLIEADAGDVPLPSGSYHLAISECAASFVVRPGPPVLCGIPATPDPPSSPRSCILPAVAATSLHQTPRSQRIRRF
jgi:hypothetical protein